MVETIQRKLNDSAAARWTALVLIALMMFFAYMFVDVMSPLKSLVESARGWDSGTFGTYAASEYFLNVFVFFLIFAGIILDKMGIRFTGMLSASLMVAGAAIKLVGISEWFQTTELCAKEMALAMGLEMAIARLGVFAVMWLAPMVSNMFDKSIVAPVAFCTALLVIGLLCFSVFVLMDRKLDRQMIASGELKLEKSSDEEFHVRDLGKIFSSKMFWLVALLCVLYYSAIFPFQRYAPNFLEVTLHIDAESAARLFSCFPILAMVLTPFLGALLDFRGKGATMLMIGAIIMIACHLSFAFLLPMFPSKWLALLLVVTLGVSFSLVPAALWPSVPKIIDEKVLGSAYCVIFWIQNIGLCLVPLLIGKVLDATGGYVMPMIIFSSFGVLAFIFSLYLKIEDRRKGYGLELPNIRK